VRRMHSFPSACNPLRCCQNTPLLFDSPAQTRFLLPHISRGIIEARRPLAKRCVVQARHHTWKPAREKIRQGHHPVDESLGPKIKLGHKYTPTRSSCYFP